MGGRRGMVRRGASSVGVRLHSVVGDVQTVLGVCGNFEAAAFDVAGCMGYVQSIQF
jgi:hypothetical protein